MIVFLIMLVIAISLFSTFIIIAAVTVHREAARRDTERAAWSRLRAKKK